MTLRILDGADYTVGGNSATLLLHGGWSFHNWGGAVSTSVRRFGYGASFEFTGNGVGHNGGAKVFDPYNQSSTVFFAGGLYRATSAPTDGGPQISIGVTASAAWHLCVRLISFGRVALYRCTNQGSLRFCTWTLIGLSDPDLFDDYSWNWIECKAFIDTTAGECEVRLNGKTVIHVVSANTRNQSSPTVPAYCDMAGPAAGGADNFSAYVDDFAVWDDEGDTCNDWLGTNRIKAMLVIADGDNIDSTIGGSSPAATNWQSVLNANMDDTKYVYIPYTDVGNFDLYDVNPIISAPIVHAIQIRVSARQDDATQLTLKTLLKSGTTTSEGVEEHMAQDYNFWYTKYEVNPDTGFGFTQSEANAIQVGYKLEAVES